MEEDALTHRHKKSADLSHNPRQVCNNLTTYYGLAYAYAQAPFM